MIPNEKNLIQSLKGINDNLNKQYVVKKDDNLTRLKYISE